MVEEETAEVEETPEGTEEAEETPEEESSDPELQKAIKRRDRALAEKRKLAARVAELEKQAEGKPEDDPVAKANVRLVNASARTILAGLGVTDRDDQKDVIAALNLSDVSVDDEGPDEDEISDRIERLRTILTGKETRSRAPRTVRTADRGGPDAETNSDPDKARYRRIMKQGGR
jgi:hypothetical protein